MIIDRYIAAEVIKPFLLITLVLGLMFVAISAAALMENVLAGEIELSVIATLVFLRTLIALEVLLPSALFVAVMVALRRLHSDSEMVALQSFGVSDTRALRAIFAVILVVALLVSLLSLVGRPWAYRTSYAIEEQASLRAGIEYLQADRFMTLGGDSMTVFFNTFDEKTGVASEVFVQQKKISSFRVIRARTMRVQAKQQRLLIRFQDGYAYELGDAGSTDALLKFSDLKVWLDLRPTQSVKNKRKALATSELSASNGLKNVAEYQWRLTAPVSAFLLGILAIPLGRMKLRKHGGMRIVAAVVLYVLFLNLTNLFKTWLEHGDIAAIPGLWSVHFGLAAMLLCYFLWHRYRF